MSEDRVEYVRTPTPWIPMSYSDGFERPGVAAVWAMHGLHDVLFWRAGRADIVNFNTVFYGKEFPTAESAMAAVDAHLAENNGQWPPT